VTGPRQTDPRRPDAAGVALQVEADPPPVVRAFANDLAARLRDPAFADETRRVRGTVSLQDASTPQAATIRLGDRGVTLAHGFAETAELRAEVDLRGTAEPELEGAGEHPELAQWLHSLLSAQPPEWPRAAERFWSVLSPMPGAPGALRVVDLKTGDEHRFGSERGRAYELHGPTDDLVDVLTGRVPVVDAAFAGRIFVRGSFPELSVLSGAGHRVRYGLDGDLRERATDV
jgi:hypothetical protein